MDGHGPFLRCRLSREIHHLHCGFVGGKYLALPRGFVDHAVQRLDGVGGVDRMPNVRRVFEQRDQGGPVALPGLADLRILPILFLGEALQLQQRRVFGRGLVDTLQIGGDCLVVLPRDVFQ